MNKNYFIAATLFLIANLAGCGSQKNADSPTTDNSKEGSANSSNFPTTNFPQPNFPEPNFPQPNFPKPNFPEINFPKINFPEVTFPDVKIQQSKNTTIYTLPADILFDFDKANLRLDAEAALQQISNSIAQRFPNAPFQINGHTDSVGNNAYNLELSKRRAESVGQWLIKNKEMKPDQMTIKGLGETQPAAPNTNPDGSDNPQGRQQNRRVEIIVRANNS